MTLLSGLNTFRYRSVHRAVCVTSPGPVPVIRCPREALMSQSGTQAGEDELHRGGWVEGPVRLYRDEWGIPHVRARSVHDAFVGQGYVHAMDRLWQMDAARKQMEGRWSEWVGAAGLPAD